MWAGGGGGGQGVRGSGGSGPHTLYLAGSPLPQGKWPKHSLPGKTQGIRTFSKIQGFLFAQVVNFLILKVKIIVIFVVKISKSFQNLAMSAKSILHIKRVINH